METLGDLINDALLKVLSSEDLDKPLVMVNDYDDLILAEIEVCNNCIKVKPQKDFVVF